MKKKSLSTRIKLWRAKRKLRALYMEYHAVYDQFDCGTALAEYVSPRLWRLRDQCNQCVERINELDPDAKLKVI